MTRGRAHFLLSAVTSLTAVAGLGGCSDKPATLQGGSTARVLSGSAAQPVRDQLVGKNESSFPKGDVVVFSLS